MSSAQLLSAVHAGTAKSFAFKPQHRAARGRCIPVLAQTQPFSTVAGRVGRTIGALALSAVLFAGAGEAGARLEGVNKPELLPSGPVTPIIDVAGFLTEGEVRECGAASQQVVCVESVDH